MSIKTSTDEQNKEDKSKDAKKVSLATTLLKLLPDLLRIVVRVIEQWNQL